MNKAGKIKAIIACFALVLCFTVFSARLVYLQVIQHEYYSAIAAEKQTGKRKIPSTRGTIMDVHGEILAVTEPLKSVIADGSLISDPARVATTIADLLEMSPEELASKLTTERKYLVVKHKVAETTAAEIARRLEKEKLRGIYFEQSGRRIYPNGKMLGHVLGFLNSEQEGVQGIEMTMNEYLKGQDGFRSIVRDRKGSELVLYRGLEWDARHGYNVKLTIDMGLQAIVEEELEAAYKEFRPEVGVAILMDPHTGRILAMSNRPHFDPNTPAEGKFEEMKNAAIINLVEPGSTFKIVTVAAALSEKIVTPETVLFLENGRFHFAGKVLKDHGHGPFPNLSVHDVLVKSSNIGVAKLAMKMGEAKFYSYLRSFGFGERTGIGLPGEIPGILHPPHKWSKISISRIPMGQGVATTPMQVVMAMATIANGGKVMWPQIVDSVLDDQQNVVVSYPPEVLRQVVPPEVCEKVRLSLKEVVSKRGTARNAAVAGFTAGGKTGTAEKPRPNGGGYYKDKYVVSFVGMMPADDPKLVCLVLFDDAKVPVKQNYGGVLAAPVFSKIMTRAARYLNLQPDDLPAPTGTVAQRLPREVTSHFLPF